MAHDRSPSLNSFSLSSDSEERPLSYERSDVKKNSKGYSKVNSGESGGPDIETPKARRSTERGEAMNEESPLLSPVQHPDDVEEHISERSRLHGGREASDREELRCHDGGEVDSKPLWYLLLLTLSIGGLQIAWAVELSNGSPYLLGLGMSKSLLAIVWIAGPLSGTLVQPYVGILSDNCRSPWGKRIPFMLAGAGATMVSLMALAWTREIVGGFLGLFGAAPDSEGVKVSAIIFAVFFVYVLDFSINTVQAGIRAFIVDNAPTHQQEDANSWAGRWTGIGNILGYLSGYVDLPRIVPFLGNTQFKVLCAIASVALGGTVVLSAIFIRERDPRLDEPARHENGGVISFFKQVFKSMRRLSPQIRKVCEVQFFNWIGWFPFLFYITTYIGQLHVNPFFEANPNLSPGEINDAWDHATRVGTFALLIFAITSFSANMILPLFIIPTYRAPLPPPQEHNIRPSTPGTPGTLSASMTFSFTQSPSPESHSRITRLLSACQIPWLTLRRAWLLSHILFAVCMLCTFFITSVPAATTLVGFIGISWALTLWAPFALISAEISKQETARRFRTAGRSDGATHTIDAEEDGGSDQAGVVLGLHNVAIAAPQIIATLVSSAIFKMAQKPRGEPGDDSVGWVLRFGGIAALIAAYMTSRVEDDVGVKDFTESVVGV